MVKAYFAILTLLLAAISAIGQNEIQWHRKINGIPLVAIACPLDGDTLVITDTSIHFIKVAEQVFEVKRLVQLLPAISQFKFEPITPIIRSPNLYNDEGWIYTNPKPIVN